MKTILMITLMSIGIGSFANNSTSTPTSNSDATVINYPVNAIQNNDEGTVLVYFKVSNGTVESTHVLQSVTPSLDSTAINFVNNQSPDFFKQLEESGKSEFILPVLFDIR